MGTRISNPYLEESIENGGEKRTYSEIKQECNELKRTL